MNISHSKITCLPTRPRSAVGNVSGYRCVSDCRSRGLEFDPGPVPYFRGDWSWNNLCDHSPPSTDSFKKGCCQLQAKVCAQITGEELVQACPGKSVVRWTDRPAMTIAVDLGRKATKQTNKQNMSSTWNAKIYSDIVRIEINAKYAKKKCLKSKKNDIKANTIRWNLVKTETDNVNCMVLSVCTDCPFNWYLYKMSFP